MKDYTEIIDALRHCAEDGFDSCDRCPYAAAPESCAGLAKKAADAIEELSNTLNQLEDGCFYIKKNGVLYKSQRVVPDGAKSITLPRFEFEPPKEE